MGSGRIGRGPGVLGIALTAVLLAGCGSDGPGAGASDPPASAAPSASAVPVLTDESGRELSAAEVEAFRQATDVVVAYRQTIVDLYSGARTDLNDLYKVATGELLDQNLRNVQQGLSAGRRVEPDGVQVVLVAAAPVRVDQAEGGLEIVVRACIDGSQVSTVQPDGSEVSGVREELDYTLAPALHLPPPSLAVSRVEGDPLPEDRTC
jgi:hypothetical protein